MNFILEVTIKDTVQKIAQYLSSFQCHFSLTNESISHLFVNDTSHYQVLGPFSIIDFTHWLNKYLKSF